jgi:hypothetical protein
MKPRFSLFSPISFLSGRNVTVDFSLDIQRPGLCPQRKSGLHWFSLVQSAVLGTRYTAICRVFVFQLPHHP